MKLRHTIDFLLNDWLRTEELAQRVASLGKSLGRLESGVSAAEKGLQQVGAAVRRCVFPFSVTTYVKTSSIPAAAAAPPCGKMRFDSAGAETTTYKAKSDAAMLAAIAANSASLYCVLSETDGDVGRFCVMHSVVDIRGA